MRCGHGGTKATIILIDAIYRLYDTETPCWRIPVPNYASNRARAEDWRTMTVREISAGGVVLRRMRGRWYVALIEPAGRGDSVSEGANKTRKKSAPKPLRALPKGLVEVGESPQETARREVNEETGLEADPVIKLGDIKYFYVRSWGDRERVFKIVSFYLFRYRSGTLGEISEEMREEVQSAEWMPLEEAPARLPIAPSARCWRKHANICRRIRSYDPLFCGLGNSQVLPWWRSLRRETSRKYRHRNKSLSLARINSRARPRPGSYSNPRIMQAGMRRSFPHAIPAMHAISSATASRLTRRA